MLAVFVGVVWWIYSLYLAPPDLTESILGDIVVSEPAAPREPPEGRPAPTGTFETWAQEASAKVAGEVDDDFRKVHAATSLLGGTQQLADLLEDLADPQFAQRPPDAPGAEEPIVQPYESQYEAFYDECLETIKQNVDADEADRDGVFEAAERWADEKRAPLEKQLGEQLQLPLGL